LLKGPNQLDERVPIEVGTIQVNFCKNPQCRVFYNFVEVGRNKQTPAMRLGLAKGKITVENIICYQQ
jgi:hypothetical protein